MSKILLIHGACFGAWCWEAVVADLAALGHQARAIDLPGRADHASLADQARAIVAALDGPTVLLGHSAGGFAITAAAELSRDVVGLIYLCAYVPKAGMTLADMRRAASSQPMAGAFVVDRPAGLFGFRADRARDLFFNDCADATQNLVMQAIAPMETALPSVAQAVALPRAAIICDNDQAIAPADQERMARGIAQRRHLPLGHAPFLADPLALARTIAEMAGAMG